ncbi:hypothetical protein GH714_036661 [Hevea brasiliensis]|uniref:Uncharacterized protein n=1 Tax=Hevea brasiliensis TaxID=3981 RepID=A0A6A6L480_HEVBR|nr:hypothetical protein GH714_036661 [Hevea brasiliensis]
MGFVYDVAVEVGIPAIQMQCASACSFWTFLSIPDVVAAHQLPVKVNSRFLSEVWKLGLDMKDVCDRRVVEKMVNDLMVDRREKFVKSMDRMAELARKSVLEGGSSSCCLDRLIEDIRLVNSYANDNHKDNLP